MKKECEHKLGTVNNQYDSFEFVTDFQEFEHHYDYKYKFKYCPDCGEKLQIVDNVEMFPSSKNFEVK